MGETAGAHGGTGQQQAVAPLPTLGVSEDHLSPSPPPSPPPYASGLWEAPALSFP